MNKCSVNTADRFAGWRDVFATDCNFTIDGVVGKFSKFLVSDVARLHASVARDKNNNVIADFREEKK
jgi:hypothetical protein